MAGADSPCLLTTTKQEKYKWGKSKVGVLVLTEEQLAKENSTAKNDAAAEESNQQQPKVSRVFGEFKSANAARENLPPPPPAKRPSADSPTEASPVSSEIAPDAPVVYRVPWLKMKEVAPGWIMHTDKKTGRPFYHHAGSGKTTWVKPPGCIDHVKQADLDKMDFSYAEGVVHPERACKLGRLFHEKLIERDEEYRALKDKNESLETQIRELHDKNQKLAQRENQSWHKSTYKNLIFLSQMKWSETHRVLCECKDRAAEVESENMELKKKLEMFSFD